MYFTDVWILSMGIEKSETDAYDKIVYLEPQIYSYV